MVTLLFHFISVDLWIVAKTGIIFKSETHKKYKPNKLRHWSINSHVEGMEEPSWYKFWKKKNYNEKVSQMTIPPVGASHRRAGARKPTLASLALQISLTQSIYESVKTKNAKPHFEFEANALMGTKAVTTCRICT